VYAQIVEVFPDTPVITAIGNNDVEYHDQAPTTEDKESYYSDLWELMYENVPANAHIVANETIKAQWMDGGYFAYQLTDDIIAFSINGMYPFWENWTDEDEANKMIEWMGGVLEDNPDQSWMTFAHVYPGNNYFTDLEVLWNITYTNKFLETIKPHQDRLIVAVGAHIHHV
jgi:hypothetical protein